MKVLFININGGFFSEVEQDIILAARGLRSRGHRCFFASLNKNGSSYDEYLGEFERGYIIGQTFLEEIIAETAPDVVYLHKYPVVKQVLKAAGSIRVVRMMHDHDVHCPRKNKYFFHKHKICTRAAGLACYADLAFLEKREGRVRYVSIRKKLQELRDNRKLDCCIAGSSFLKDQLEKNGFFPEKVSILHPCVIPSDYPSEPTGDSSDILYVGQLTFGKGVDILLRAVQFLLQSGVMDGRLHIVGEGDAEGELKHIARDLDISEYIVFHGFLPTEDIQVQYETAAVVVFPSRWPEPFGMAGLEAMLHKRPVIGAAAGGIPDWLDDGKTGLLFEPGNHIQLAEKLATLLGDAGIREKMGEAGYDSALRNFSFESYITKLEKLLKGDVVA